MTVLTEKRTQAKTLHAIMWGCLILIGLLLAYVITGPHEVGPIYPRWTQAVAFTADNSRVVSATGSEVLIWDVATRLSQRLPPNHDARVEAVAINRANKFLVTGDWGGKCVVWNLTTRVAEMEFRTGGPVYAIAVEPDTELIAVGVRTEVQVWSLKLRFRIITLSLRGLNTDVKFSSNGKHLAAAASGPNGGIVVWNTSDWSIIAASDMERSSAERVCYSSNDQNLVVGCGDGKIRMVGVFDSTLKMSIAAHQGHVNCILATLDGSKIVSGGEDGYVRMWLLPNMDADITLPKHPGPVLSIAASSDGRFLVSGCCDLSGNDPPHTLRVWDIESGIMIKELIDKKAVSTH